MEFFAEAPPSWPEDPPRLPIPKLLTCLPRTIVLCVSLSISPLFPSFAWTSLDCVCQFDVQNRICYGWLLGIHGKVDEIKGPSGFGKCFIFFISKFKVDFKLIISIYWGTWSTYFKCFLMLP